MVDVTHDTDDTDDEQFDLDIRVPGVAFDIGQKGFPRVFVMQQLADTVSEYDDARDGKGQADYLKNALVRTQPSDAVYQVVYLPESPIGGSDLNDPATRYPVPESRLIPLRTEQADPIDDSSTWGAAEAAYHDVLEDLFRLAHHTESTISVAELDELASMATIKDDVIKSARLGHRLSDNGD